jgi:hypothetical protein
MPQIIPLVTPKHDGLVNNLPHQVNIGCFGAGLYDGHSKTPAVAIPHCGVGGHRNGVVLGSSVSGTGRLDEVRGTVGVDRSFSTRRGVLPYNPI